MGKSVITSFGIVLAVAVVLLFAPLTASATGSVTNMLAPAEHGVSSDHRVTVRADTLGQHDSPADQPLHCHLKSPQPQEAGPNLSIVNGDLPQLTSDYISATAPNYETPSFVARTSIPVPARHRFILFGNFRS